MDIDQDLLDKVRRRAEAEGLSFREVLNQIIHRGLTTPAPKRKPYVMPVLDLGVDPTVNINELLAELDIEDFIRVRDREAKRR
ncbi:MAG: hypothetical protein WD771_10740 [Gemmatimonadaceae bacterium]